MSVTKYLNKDDIKAMVEIMCREVRARVQSRQGYGENYEARELERLLKNITDNYWETNHKLLSITEIVKKQEAEDNDKLPGVTHAHFLKWIDDAMLSRKHIKELVNDIWSQNVDKLKTHIYEHVANADNKHMGALRSQLHEYGKGVQNVYAEFIKLQSLVNVDELERANKELKKFRKLGKILKSLDD
jgi:hypothetical protein